MARRRLTVPPETSETAGGGGAAPAPASGPAPASAPGPGPAPGPAPNRGSAGPPRPPGGAVPLAETVAAAAEARAAAARDARRLAEAEAEGRLLRDLPLDRIEAGHLARDRVTDAQPDEETQALVASIAEHGQRTPAEVVPLPEGRFGLVSGWRRLQALRALHAHTGDAKFATLRAVVRARDETGLPDPAAYVAMVEENEVRLGLTPYERGRVAVRAVEAGAFDDVAEAVEALFAAGSKTRRHKIRKCARLAEELGEALDPLGPRLTERAALKLAEALDKGGAAALAGALAMTEGQGAEARLTALSRAADAAIHGTARAAPALRGAGRIAGRLPLTAGLELVEREGREGPVFELKGPDAALPGVADLARAVLLTAEWPKSLPGSAQGAAQGSGPGSAQGSGPGFGPGSRSARDATPPEE